MTITTEARGALIKAARRVFEKGTFGPAGRCPLESALHQPLATVDWRHIEHETSAWADAIGALVTRIESGREAAHELGIDIGPEDGVMVGTAARRLAWVARDLAAIALDDGTDAYRYSALVRVGIDTPKAQSAATVHAARSEAARIKGQSWATLAAKYPDGVYVYGASAP